MIRWSQVAITLGFIWCLFANVSWRVLWRCERTYRAATAFGFTRGQSVSADHVSAMMRPPTEHYGSSDPQICTGFVTRPGRCEQATQLAGNAGTVLFHRLWRLSVSPFQWCCYERRYSVGVRLTHRSKSYVMQTTADWRLSLYWRGDHPVAADLSVVMTEFWRCFWRLVISNVSFNLAVIYYFRGTPLYVQLLVFYSCTHGDY